MQLLGLLLENHIVEVTVKTVRVSVPNLNGTAAHASPGHAETLPRPHLECEEASNAFLYRRSPCQPYP